MKNSFWIIAVAAISIVIVKTRFISSWTIQDTDSLLGSLLTELISIFITVFLIDRIVKRAEVKKQTKLKEQMEEEYKDLISGVLGNRLRRLFTEVSTVYMNFVLKKPAELSKDIKLHEYKDIIVEILNDLDKHVAAGFRSKPISCYIVDESKMTIPNESIINYQEFCEYIFKAKIQTVIDGFIQRYISVLPEDLKISIYTIENSIDDFVFITPLRIGHKAPMPTTSEDILALKKEFKRIGDSLLDIYQIIDSTS
ncbi:hypothetical protein [Paenibacillus sp. CMAA1364]